MITPMRMPVDFHIAIVAFLVVVAVALVSVFGIDHMLGKMNICRHRATYIVYEEDFHNGEHHTYRNYVCFDCGKTVRREKLQ